MLTRQLAFLPLELGEVLESKLLVRPEDGMSPDEVPVEEEAAAERGFEAASRAFLE
jgi:hypothetical protein